MLADCLGALPGAIVTPESQFIDTIRLAFNKNQSFRALERAMDSSRFKVWRIDRRDLRYNESTNFRDAVSQVLALYASKNSSGPNIDLWIDHTPNNFKRSHLLKEIFPNAKFIHIIRDPRAVIASVLQLDWGPDTITRATRWWLQETSYGLAHELAYPESCLRVKYEDLVVADRFFWKNLISSIDPNTKIENFERFISGGNSTVPKYTVKQHSHVGKGPNLNRIYAWKNKLSDRQIEIIEADLGSMMRALGYETFTDFPSKATRFEKLKDFDWPIEIRIQLAKRLKKKIRENFHRSSL